MSLSYRTSDDGYFSVMISETSPIPAEGENAEVDGAPASLDTIGDTTSLGWSCDGVHYAVVGPYDEETILEIGERIGCE